MKKSKARVGGLKYQQLIEGNRFDTSLLILSPMLFFPAFAASHNCGIEITITEVLVFSASVCLFV